MMRTIRWTVPGLIGLLMAMEMLLPVAPAFAQAPNGSFSRLSPGNQRIAQALFEAQHGTRPLTLDQVAARRGRGQGWGDVFRTMRTEGRVEAPNLGQVMSAYNERHRPDTKPRRSDTGDRVPARRDGPGRGPGRSDDVSASPAGPGRGVGPSAGNGLGNVGAPGQSGSGGPGLGAGHGMGQGGGRGR
jgi:hypothetical protein